MAKPAKYFENNVEEGVALMGSLLKANIRRLVFSSTCATYGEPKQTPISETCPQWPKNPYGWSKFTMERLLESYDHAYGLKFVALRYFNASGATELRGEYHEPESHLVPECAGRRGGSGSRKSRCLGKIIRRRMEPAFAITCTWPIWRTRIFSHSSTCAREASRILSIWEPGMVTRCWKSSRPRGKLRARK